MSYGRFVSCAACTTALLMLLTVSGQAASAQTTTPTPGTDTNPAAPLVTVPLAGISDELSAIRSEIEQATSRAVQVETEIAAVDAEQRALEDRIAVTTERIAVQRLEIQAAEQRLAEADTRFRIHLVQVYKRGSLEPLSLLLSADNLAELVSRADVLTRIAKEDSRVVADLNIAVADSRYQAAQLDDLLAQERALKQVQDERRVVLDGLLAEQQALVVTLTQEERDALARARSFNAASRAEWNGSSIPPGTSIPRATATVDTHPGVSFVISAYMPRSYRATGESFDAVCSWYGPGFDGRRAASGQIFNEDDLTCASRTLPFGTVLALTRADRRVIVYVNDRGPYIAGRDLDLSKAAAQVLGFGGVSTVRAEIVVPVQ